MKKKNDCKVLLAKISGTDTGIVKVRYGNRLRVEKDSDYFEGLFLKELPSEKGSFVGKDVVYYKAD